MQWTETLPEIPGFYWLAQYPGDRPDIVEVSEVFELGLQVNMFEIGRHRSLSDLEGYWWCGPLTPPPLPCPCRNTETYFDHEQDRIYNRCLDCGNEMEL